jgi:hypothetical protein
MRMLVGQPLIQDAVVSCEPSRAEVSANILKEAIAISSCTKTGRMDKVLAFYPG